MYWSIRITCHLSKSTIINTRTSFGSCVPYRLQLLLPSTDAAQSTTVCQLLPTFAYIFRGFIRSSNQSLQQPVLSQMLQFQQIHARPRFHTTIFRRCCNGGVPLTVPNTRWVYKIARSFFTRTLQNIARPTGQTRVFCEISMVRTPGNDAIPDMNAKNGRKRGVTGPETGREGK